MANREKSIKENSPGRFYVDDQCIACDACVGVASDFFHLDPDKGHAYVKKQPTDQAGEDQCREAMEGCPVEAIGNDGV